MKRLLSVLALLALVVLSGCIADNTGLATAPAGTASTGTGTETFTIPVESISPQAKWFEYDVQGVKVRFFAVKDSEGNIKTAFDSCDVCFSAGKGYRQEGEFMVCNNCGNRYPIDGIGTQNKNPGGCWPGYLPSRVEGGQLVIEKGDLAEGRNRFS